MMSFRIGDMVDNKDSGMLKGTQREIACDCWFTSQGRTIPRTIKVMSEEGTIQTINEIRLLSTDEKAYSGIRTIEHICIINANGMELTVKLIFTKESCKWTLVKV